MKDHRNPKERLESDISNNKNMHSNNDSEPLEFIDLSNIDNITDLNQLTGMRMERNQRDLSSPIDVDNIAVDLDDEELEQMQRIIG